MAPMTDGTTTNGLGSARPPNAANAPTSPKMIAPTIAIQRRPRRAKSPRMAAYAASNTPIPTRRAILSAVPKMSMAAFLSQAGVASMKRSPTSRTGERSLAEIAVVSSATARPNRAAATPARSARRREMAGASGVSIPGVRSHQLHGLDRAHAHPQTTFRAQFTT